MAIPKYFEMYRTFLEAIGNEGFHGITEIKEQIIKNLKLLLKIWKCLYQAVIKDCLITV